MEWDRFAEMFRRAHKQGEHIAIVGPNGTGKTQLGLALCQVIGARTAKDGRPARVVILNYKPRDKTVSEMQVGDEWQTIKEWPPSYGQEHCVVWPRGGPPSQAARRHRAVFVPLIDQIYAEGGQTVYIPEAAYFERAQPAGLGMGGTMEQLWSTARSLDLTVISDTQRPRQVTRLMWSEPAWLVIFHIDDRDDLKRVAEMSGQEIAVYSIVPKLGGHECLVVRRQRARGKEMRELYVTRVELVTRNTRNKRNKERE